MEPKPDIADRIQLVISFVLRMILTGAIVSAAVAQSWITLFTASLVLILTFIPSIIERNYKIYLPIEFEVIITAFVYASLFLGEVHDYYTIFWWWDLVLHSAAGLTFGFLGFLIMFVLYGEGKITTSPILIAVFSFCFAVAIGSIWEIFEFSMDQFFSLNMQKSGLIDTMWDVIVNAASALVTAVIGYFYVRGGPSFIVDRLVTKFVRENPQLFNRKKWQKYY